MTDTGVHEAIEMWRQEMRERAEKLLRPTDSWQKATYLTQQVFLVELTGRNGHLMNDKELIDAWTWFEMGARVTTSFRAGVSAAWGLVAAAGPEALRRAVERYNAEHDAKTGVRR